MIVSCCSLPCIVYAACGRLPPVLKHSAPVSPSTIFLLNSCLAIYARMTGILTYFCYTAYQRVRLLIADSEITSNPAYNFGGPPDSGVTAYHGFARDADLLDISKPAQLDTSPPSFGGSPRFGGGGVLTRNPVEAYQP
ncbi:unnamed protein product [Dicrocoelium dendriticum]|nr:unnamed protein product [Dicrocoelium dendriticum]